MAKWKSVSAVLAITAIAGATMFGVLATQAQAALRHVDGTVLSKDTGARTFRITTQNGSRMRFKVNSNTLFERIAGGFGGLDKGMKVQVDYVSTASGPVAKKVEPQNSGGGGGGGGAADGPNHT
jgi:hypothetical protein